jgi:ribose-phosphate pyrophosphokinase
MLRRGAVISAMSYFSLSCLHYRNPTFLEEGAKPKSYGRAAHSRKQETVSLDSMALIAGTGHRALSEDISRLIGVPLTDATVSRFADGEVSIQIMENIRSKAVYIIQPCVSPVNDSIMELLLTISCARRAGAERIVAVIPYFGYKHHRRNTPLQTKLNSRYLSSVAVDFARMLQEMGVDSVISVELQRPGQGHEACFFDNAVPLETSIDTDVFIEHLTENKVLQEPIVVVTPNPEYHKKARKFQSELQKHYSSKIAIGAFFNSPKTASDKSTVDILGFGIDKVLSFFVILFIRIGLIHRYLFRILYVDCWTRCCHR